MKLQVQIQSKYGRDLIYPINTTAKNFAKLLKKKTFSEDELLQIQILGYEIEWILRSLDLKT